MKKNLALLLVVVFALTAVLGLVPVASAEESTAPSTEIAYFNVSLRVGATLLFAVPADGYSVQADGTVPNLKLLVTNDCANKGIGGVADGELLEASGKMAIGGKDHVIFEYSGLAANEMTEIVYARTVYFDENGFYDYGEAKGYSLPEFLQKSGSFDADTAALIDMLLAYGDAAAAYQPKAGAKANFTASESDSSLYAIKVKRVVDGVAIDDKFEINQYAKAGTVALSVPPVYGASLTSCSGADVVDGKVTVSGDVELTLNYTTNKAVVDFTYSSANDTVGNYTGLAGNSATKPSGSYTIGNAWGTSGSHDYSYGNFSVVEEGGVKCLRYAHNGGCELKLGNAWTGRGIGDSLDFSLEITVKAGANGTFPRTSFRIDRIGDLNGQINSSTAVAELLELSENGDILMKDYFGNDVVLAKGDPNKFQTVTVACDVSENKFIGYVDGVKCGETVMNVENANLLASHYAGVNNRLRLTMYGGYQAENWNELGFPAAIVGEGKLFNFVESEKGAYIIDKDSGLYRKYNDKDEFDVENYADATKYGISYTKGEELWTAVQEYVNANQYFYFGGAKVYVGNPLAD